MLNLEKKVPITNKPAQKVYNPIDFQFSKNNHTMYEHLAQLLSIININIHLILHLWTFNLSNFTSVCTRRVAMTTAC